MAGCVKCPALLQILARNWETFPQFARIWQRWFWKELFSKWKINSKCITKRVEVCSFPHFLLSFWGEHVFFFFSGYERVREYYFKMKKLTLKASRSPWIGGANLHFEHTTNAIFSILRVLQSKMPFIKHPLLFDLNYYKIRQCWKDLSPVYK